MQERLWWIDLSTTEFTNFLCCTQSVVHVLSRKCSYRYCLTSFHSNHSCINNVTSGHNLGFFLKIQKVFKFYSSLNCCNTESDEKTAFSN